MRLWPPVVQSDVTRLTSPFCSVVGFPCSYIVTLWHLKLSHTVILLLLLLLLTVIMCVSSVYVEMLNRRQNRLQLVVYDVACFMLTEDSVESMHDALDSLSVPGSVWIVCNETSAYWVNVSILPLLLECSANT